MQYIFKTWPKFDSSTQFIYHVASFKYPKTGEIVFQMYTVLYRFGI
jgi:hypothetical protein